MTAEYKNRYGDKIYFTDLPLNTVIMTGYDEYLRMGTENAKWEIEPEITFVDPSGGPFISIQDNLKSIFKDGKDRIIVSMKVYPEGVIFNLKQ